jgi:hypothetical protein
LKLKGATYPAFGTHVLLFRNMLAGQVQVDELALDKGKVLEQLKVWFMLQYLFCGHP